MVVRFQDFETLGVREEERIEVAEVGSGEFFAFFDWFARISTAKELRSKRTVTLGEQLMGDDVSLAFSHMEDKDRCTCG
jgi:hypothetical protein